MRDIVILGATATGKTALSVSVAKALQAEIVSVDSMYVYRQMDVGTAKPTIAEMQGVPHHNIDILEPHEECSAALVSEASRKATESVHAKSKPVIAVGGSGLYVDSFVSNLSFAPTDETVRAQIQKSVDEQGVEEVYRQLQGLDPEAALRIDPKNERRVVRAMEVISLTNGNYSKAEPQLFGSASPTKPLLIGLKSDRESALLRIEKRVKTMIQSGLIEEVQQIHSSKLGFSATAEQAIGYKETVSYLKGELSTESELVELIAIRTRQFARRQGKWFQRYEGVHWFDVESMSSEDILNESLNIYSEQGEL